MLRPSESNKAPEESGQGGIPPAQVELVRANKLALSIARVYKEGPTEASPLLLFNGSILALQPDGGPDGGPTF